MKPICPSCESENVLYRDTDKTYLCRRCGKRWEKEKKQ